MGNEREPKEVDIAALLEAVHGRSDESRREEQVDLALRAIETTHRKASMAVRNFEHHGRLEAEANVLAALGALADDSGAASHASQATAPGDPPPPAGVSPAETTQVIGEAVEATAVVRPNTARPDASPPPTPAFLSDEPTSPGTGSGSNGPASSEVTAAPPPAVSSTEVTRTFAVEMLGKAPAAAPHREQRAVPTDPKFRPSNVLSGRGADMPNKEATKTNVIRRPKKG